MDWGRTGYSKLCRFSRDPDIPPVRIVWYFTKLDFQDFDSSINSRIWDSDDTRELDLGEDFLDDRQGPYRHEVRDLDGEHQCGPEEWFLDGQPEGIDGPPVEYDEQLIPLCCGDPDALPHGGLEIGGEVPDRVLYVNPTAGGLEIGGEVPDAVAYIDPTAGGLEIGGEVPDAVAYIDPTAGGLEIGGEVPDVYVPGGSVPGTTCADAGDALHAHTYTGPIPGSPPDVYKWQITVTGTYTVTASDDFGLHHFTVAKGTTCVGLVDIGEAVNGLPFTFGASAGEIVVVIISDFLMGDNYAIRLDP